MHDRTRMYLEMGRCYGYQSRWDSLRRHKQTKNEKRNSSRKTTTTTTKKKKENQGHEEDTRPTPRMQMQEIKHTTYLARTLAFRLAHPR